GHVDGDAARSHRVGLDAETRRGRDLDVILQIDGGIARATAHHERAKADLLRAHRGVRALVDRDVADALVVSLDAVGNGGQDIAVVVDGDGAVDLRIDDTARRSRAG